MLDDTAYPSLLLSDLLPNLFDGNFPSRRSSLTLERPHPRAQTDFNLLPTCSFSA